MAGEARLDVVQRDDGTWAVVRGGVVVSTHDLQASAEAERTRIAESGQDGPDDIGRSGAHPTNVDG